MALKISGGERPIEKVFSNDYIFEIPPYQRPYSWTTEQVEELLDDLLRAANESNPTDPEPYFLGSIVLAKTEGDPRSEVIDGQQRLTTLTMLLAALAARLPDGHELMHHVIQPAKKYAKAAEVPRLTLREKDAAFFREYIQEPAGLERLIALDATQLDNDAQRNLRANARLIVERLTSEPDRFVEDLATYLVNECFLIVVSTPGSDSAFRIFAVLNDRGLDLSHADILKNELIGAISDKGEQAVTTKAWEDAEELLGTDGFADLFSHLRMIYAKTKQRHTLLREFRDNVTGQIGNHSEFIQQVVVPYADLLSVLIERSWRSDEHAKDINGAIAWLQRLDNFDWIPPAMRFLYLNSHDSSAVRDFLWRLERLAGSMFIRRLGINGRIDRYGKLLQAMDDGVSVLSPGTPLDLTDEERQDTITRLDGPLYQSSRPVKYVLMRLDSALSGGEATYEHTVISVEHVLPQSPAADSPWTQLFTNDDRELWVHRLANLVLLARRKNSQASNFEFDKKKTAYFAKDDLASPFPLTTQVLAQSEWNPSVLEARQATLREKLVALWDLTPTT